MKVNIGPYVKHDETRIEEIHIDNYDVWSLYSTLALIIYPSLKKLKEIKHGCPIVDNSDVPDELKLSDEDMKHIYYGTNDDKLEARWNYILDEMIWAFEQYTLDDDEVQFHHNLDQLDMICTPIENSQASTISFNYQKDPDKPAYYVDKEGKKLHHERKANGLRLFGKYYETLWD